MRSEPRPEFETDEADEAWSNSDRCLSTDWKDPPHEVLDLIDGALKPFGLEIVTYQDSGDSHDFRVDYAAEGRAKAESFGPYVGLKACDVDPVSDPEIHAAIIKRDSDEARQHLRDTFFEAIDDAMLYGAKLDSIEFDFDTFTVSLQRRGYLIQEKPHG